MTDLRPLVPLLLLLALPVRGQQPGNVILLDHADSLVGTELGGEQVKQLIGNVKFHQGKTVVTCDRAVQYLATRKIALEGTVEVRDDSLRMVGKRGMYYSDTRIAEAFDRVMLEDPTTTLRAAYGKYFTGERKAYFTDGVYVEDTSSVLTADTLTYYRDDRRSIAAGNVTITGRHGGPVITGNHFESFQATHYGRMTEHPKVVQVDTASDGTVDTLVVTSSVMESFRDTLDRLVATEDVEVTRGGLAAQAGSAVFFSALDSVELRRSPVIWYTQRLPDDNQVTGDSIFLRLRGRALERAFVRGRAFAVSRADTAFPRRFNQMSGQEMVLHFAEKKLGRIEVVATATSLYFLFDGAAPNGLNKTTGDRITITFLEGNIDKITAIRGVEGEYVPERLVKGRESDYNLDGFNYRPHLRGRR